MTLIQVSERTCSIGQSGASCLDVSGPTRHLRHALALYREIGLHVARRLRAGRMPALSTFILPTRGGSADGGPMIFCPVDPLGPVGFDVGAGCDDLPVASLIRLWRDGTAARAAPVFAVVVERWLAAGWTMRLGVARR